MIGNSPALAEALGRFEGLYPDTIELSLGRVLNALELLGRPQDRLPPVIHVAGTNGKGSTCAFMRAMMEAAGLSVHVFTSPHLVRFNERIRLAGEIVDDARLIDWLERTHDAIKGQEITQFEATTATALLAVGPEGGWTDAEIDAARDIGVRFLPRDAAFAHPDLIRTKINLLPEGIPEVRVVDIDGLDVQADGGTHVANTTEVGRIRVVGHESKGRINKRLRIALIE